jgi:hypothetical protein
MTEPRRFHPGVVACPGLLLTRVLCHQNRANVLHWRPGGIARNGRVTG